MDKVKSIINRKIIRYLIMAIIIVSIELILFQIVYLSTKDYYLATISSFTLGLALNWIGGRLFIFKSSKRHLLHELSMIIIASLIGLGLQLISMSLCVQILGIYPLMGKTISIVVSFTWNYGFRNKYIYN